MCKARYETLLAAGRGANGVGSDDALGLPALRARLAAIVQAHSALTVEV